MSDRGRDTSHVLTEVRTVLSRAGAALIQIHHFRLMRMLGGTDFEMEHYAASINDPDLDEMVVALEEVQRRLARWRRTGRSKK